MFGKCTLDLNYFKSPVATIRYEADYCSCPYKSTFGGGLAPSLQKNYHLNLV